jgi:hypothetical protein
MEAKKLTTLFCIPPHWKNHSGIFNWDANIAVIKSTLDKYIESSNVVSTMEEYDSLTDEQKQSFDNICVQMGTIAPKVLEH